MTHPQTPGTDPARAPGRGGDSASLPGARTTLTALAAAWDETAADLTANHQAVGEGCPIAAFKAQGRVTQLGDCADELRAALATPDPALTITVLGKPAPQGSKRHVGNGRMIEQSKRVKPWREAVKEAAAAAIEATGHQRIEGPVTIEIAFCFDPPKSAPKRRKIWPTTRSSGDVDKLQRSTFDALTDAGTFRDDSQIVQVFATKAHTDDRRRSPLTIPGAVICVRALEVTT